MTDTPAKPQERWLTLASEARGASPLCHLGHDVPTALLPSLLTATLGGPASALGLIEGIADGLAGAARLGGGALADDPDRRQTVAVGGYTTSVVLVGLIGAATAVWQVAVLRAWTSAEPSSGPEASIGGRDELDQAPDELPLPQQDATYGFCGCRSCLRSPERGMGFAVPRVSGARSRLSCPSTLKR